MPRLELEPVDEVVLDIVSTANNMSRLLVEIQLCEGIPKEIKDACTPAIQGLVPLFGALADHLKKVNFKIIG